MKIAAAYIRVSTDDQIEYSPDSQRKAILDYAKRNDYIVPQEYIFVDEGISGRSTKRPAFQQMIGTAKQKSHPLMRSWCGSSPVLPGTGRTAWSTSPCSGNSAVWKWCLSPSRSEKIKRLS